MIGIMMMIRSVIVSRRIWIDSLRRSAIRRAKEKAFIGCASCTLSMWMKTSSSRGSTSTQARPAPFVSIARFSASRSRLATRSARPNTAAASTPGVWRSATAARSTSSPVPSNVTRPEWATTAAAPPCTTMRPCAR